MTLLLKIGEEKYKIERSANAIWAVAFSPPSHGSADTLIVTDWGQQLTFHSLAGQTLGKERNLGC